MSAFSDETVRQLNALTSAFYAEEAASFSATRQAPWHGWERAWEVVASAAPETPFHPLTLLDLGCGNLRFERFLSERAGGPLFVHAIDNCATLVEDATSDAAEDSSICKIALTFHELDIVDHLLAGDLASVIPAGTCDLAVAFGLMHHLPRFDLRAQALVALGRSLKPEGVAIVSFWQFLDDPRLAVKARTATERGRSLHGLPAFDPHDALLSWQANDRVFRFCHQCDDKEIDALIEEANAALSQNGDPCASASPSDMTAADRGTMAPLREVARFSADGKNGTLNRYVVLQRLAS